MSLQDPTKKMSKSKSQVKMFAVLGNFRSNYEVDPVETVEGNLEKEITNIKYGILYISYF